MTIRGDFGLKDFGVKLRRLEWEVFKHVVAAAHESIVNGSTITGSPGQPADLREGKWTLQLESEDVAILSCAEPSARSVENGISRYDGHPIKLKSAVGGFHSVGQTEQHFDKLVDEVARQVVGSNA